MSPRKTVILGLDGLEPSIVERLMAAGKLPHLAKLPFYRHLQTTTPPQSPVAWASFITGQPPTKHQLFDFVQRHPENYQPYISYSASTKEPPFKTPPFWKRYPSQPTKVLFLPDTYPATPLNGQLISGMGTPDLMGTEGRFQLFTTQSRKAKLERGEIHLLNRKKMINTRITGPKYQGLKGLKESQLPLTIKVSPKQVRLEFNHQSITLKAGQFSNWQELPFAISPWKKVWGLGQFYLQATQPHLSLYLSPLNIHPAKPLYPISYPRKYGAELVKKYGLFSTLGMPHDTWAFQARIFSQKAFLQQMDDLLTERTRVILGEFDRFPEGLFVAYLGTTDTSQHMFWGQEKVIGRHYQQVDQFVGEVQKRLTSNDSLTVLSDHGFGPFDTEFHLNAWLRERGYLHLQKGKTGEELFGNIDWRKTQAYALGFNSLYLNLKGREGQGVVSPRKKKTLLQKISRELKSIQTPKTKKKVIKQTYPGVDPDLIIGYYRGFRASWETAVGATPANLFKKRTAQWKGDHLFDATEVPGVLFSSQNLKIKNPHIEQVVDLIMKK